LSIRAGAISRATISLEPPGGKVTTSVTGWLGQAWPRAASGATVDSSRVLADRINLRRFVIEIPGCC
jgi:hypothetical protein